ncbi:MAG: neutral/alkaline non-lysosomal ceramidase N-terminal domain-containing protein [Planctomycetaceae bacterium]|nr:neutral/alkaline non-lysosomal ceramidase N-terminal domain-containing protein [Planctomycetaceae bacterium]
MKNIARLIAVASLSLLNFASAAEWQVGLGSVVITPESPTWLSGYGSRDHAAEGKVHDLFAKAVAFEDERGERLVLVTCDLGSVYQGLTGQVAEATRQRWGVGKERLVINVSHTHCAPEVAIERIVFHHLSDAEEARLQAYIDEQLIPKLIELVGAAIDDLQPSTIGVSQSAALFASNRRLPVGVESGKEYVNSQNPGGVTDHDVPVMLIRGEDESLRGILFGYACHNTTLAFYQYCGDYAGFAHQYLEEAHPGATALFVMGCGGDQNPYPRHGPEGLDHCKRHGRELADAVEHAIHSPQTEVHGPLRVAYTEVMLDLEPPPTREQLEAQRTGDDSYPDRKARYLLDQLDKHGQIATTQNCPLQAARFGDELVMIFVSGETVVDYARKPKVEFAGPLVWVAGYCNDVFAYLPSYRVLMEGGYEGRSGIIHQLVPTPFATNVEDRVMGGIRRVVKEVSE